MVDNNQVGNLDQDEFQIVDLAPIRLDRLGIERNSKSEYRIFYFIMKKINIQYEPNMMEFQLSGIPMNENFSFGVPSYSVHTVGRNRNMRADKVVSL